jgi:hypothetical protein
MPTTAKGLPYPASSSPVDVPADIAALANKVDAFEGPFTTTQRDALPVAERWVGRLIWNSTTARVERWTGTVWVLGASVVTQADIDTAAVGWSPQTQALMNHSETAIALSAPPSVRTNIRSAITVALPAGWGSMDLGFAGRLAMSIAGVTGFHRGQYWLEWDNGGVWTLLDSGLLTFEDPGGSNLNRVQHSPLAGFLAGRSAGVSVRVQGITENGLTGSVKATYRSLVATKHRRS